MHGHIQAGVFDGEITDTNGQVYHIEYVTKYPHEPLPAGAHSIIYSNDHIIQPKRSCALKKTLLHKLEELQATAKPVNRKQHPLTDEEYYNNKRKKRKMTKAVGTASGGRFCQIFVAVDHLFLRHVANNDERQAITEVTTIFSSSQTIFQVTDFNSDGLYDAITPQLVRTDVLNENSYNGKFRDGNINVQNFLNRWSEIDHSTYCLALLLTYR